MSIARSKLKSSNLQPFTPDRRITIDFHPEDYNVTIRALSSLYNTHTSPLQAPLLLNLQICSFRDYHYTETCKIHSDIYNDNQIYQKRKKEKNQAHISIVNNGLKF